ncbi:MAG: Fic family protein [Steroidobacteraceae bacterium]
MKRLGLGRYIDSVAGKEEVRAFVPAPLTPLPSLEIAGQARATLDQALLALGRLDGAAATLPDAHLLLYTFVRKEAVLSSQIEGTQSSLSDLLTHELGEIPGVPIEDVAEVSRYVAAMTHGLQRLKGGFPLSNRLLREMHGILLAAGRGAEKTPGQFRRSQNWIGGTRPGNAAFVPPPPQEISSCMGDLERFLHSDTPTLLKAALAHLQFETIHPFLDGNGRIGRLLITLIFCHEGTLREPLLYCSLYFKQHRQQYYSELNSVRETGDFERWIEFFATGIRVSAEQATVTGQRVFAVFQEDRNRLRELGRLAPTSLLVQETLQSKPLATIATLTKATGLTTPTVTQALRELERLGIVRETTGRARGRIYAYVRYLEALNAEPREDTPLGITHRSGV